MFRRIFRLPPRTPRDVDTEMREEIDAHISLGVEHLVARGVPPDVAREQMRARFGDFDTRMTSLQESARGRSRMTQRRELARTIARDLLFGARQAKRAPLFSLGIVFSLAFGIGATATVYSWMQGFVLRPLPAVHDASRLITVRPEEGQGFGVSLDEYHEWRDQSRTTTGLAALGLSLFSMQTAPGVSGSQAVPLYGMFVSANYFDLLGVPAAKGRVFRNSDDASGAEAVAVISDFAWKTHLASDPSVVGRTIHVNNRPVRIVGVAPPNFGGNLAAARFDIWVTLSTRLYLNPAETERLQRRDWRWLDVIGRLKPGLTLPQANQEFRSIGAQQAATYRENAGRGARAIPLDIGQAQQLEPLFFVLMGITILVVLLICSNVANLLLTRATARDRELAVRLALGAGRRRVIAQLMTESAGLAIVGAALGVLMAFAGDGSLSRLIPSTSVSIVAQSEIDWRFVGVVIAVTAGCVIAFGLAPAIIGSRIQLVETLKNGARGSSASRTKLRTGLVIAQFAFALSTLVTAALFLKRDRNVHAMDTGIATPEHVLVVQTEMSMAGEHDAAQWGRTIENVADRVRRVPGVRSTAVASFVPLGLVGYFRHFVRVPGTSTQTGVPDIVLGNGVSPEYFDMMGIPVLSGRGITNQDDVGAPLVAVVNDAFARKYFGGRSPIGQSFSMSERQHLIVGVVRNGRYDYRAIDNDAIPLVYYAWKQVPTPFVTVHARMDGDPMALTSAVRAAVAEVDPTMPLLPIVSLEQYQAVPFSISRSIFTVSAILSTVALILATMGLFSVISYGVSLRTREIGIRMALGATQRAVIAMFLRGAARLIAYGAFAGIVTSIALTAMMRAALPLLPMGTLAEYIVPMVALALSAFVAGFIPARRAATIDPATTLRAD